MPLTDVPIHEAPTLDRALDSLLEKDPGLWPGDADAISDRLGWLDAPSKMAGETGRLKALLDEAKAAGLTDAVVLGMGGSSATARVWAEVCTGDGLRLSVLDSTDPVALTALEAGLDLDKTLFVVGSKSGTTAESLSLFDYFRERVEDPRRFVLITDPGTPLGDRARTEGHVLFENPADIGGRYSALSFFGLVPAALMGLDVDAIVEAGADALAAPDSARGRDAYRLAAWLDVDRVAGRDKLVLHADEGLGTVAGWLEQLIAESTGKDGQGYVPVLGGGAPGPDRCHLVLTREGTPVPDELPEDHRALWTVDGPEDLARFFAVWELVTPLLAVHLRVNPFDEPDVVDAKVRARAALATLEAGGTLPAVPVHAETDHLALSAFGWPPEGAPLTELLESLPESGYLVVLDWLPRQPGIEAAVDRLMTALEERTGCAVGYGLGPRYLHSSGQLHKGGPDTGRFLLLTAETPEAPGALASLGTLFRAQARGDREALEGRGRRGVEVIVRGALAEGLDALARDLAG